MKQTGARKFAPIPKAAKILGVGEPQLRLVVKAREVKVITINGRDRIPGEWIERQLSAD